ncbi:MULTISPECIES: molybdate ABC transporter substrate-binding protein [unclassified Roseofilum]|uniref:molybdate ABC transporter substrate-binding protein n=1 Tax=unclassified Roseofilum TaxID=2620099 RepID=UPI00298DC98F|nr:MULTISPECIES: molybdate ABC transporter substrate-binding protein [unclassified Roseofilum]
MKKRGFFYLITALTLTVCISCSSGNPDTSTQTQLTVSVAASLQDVMRPIAQAYQRQASDTLIAYNFASSGTLQQQIEQGAPVDVFISASPQQMDALERKNLLQPKTRKNLLKNQVVLVTPKTKNSIKAFADLSQEHIAKIALGNPETVPAGQYGKEVLTQLKLYELLRPKFVLAKDARQVLFYVESGNVDAGIVYQTDAILSDKITIVATAPETDHSPILYPVAVLQQTESPEPAQHFIDFLWTESAQSIFQEYGFQLAQ